MTGRIVIAVLALTLAAGGCGSDDEQPASTRTQTETQERKGPSDATQIRAIATRYLEAYTKRDWQGVCATLTPRARARFKRKFGSCPAAYKVEPPEDADYTRLLMVSEVKVRGDRAVVEVGVDGDPAEKPDFKMYAAKLDGKWWLYIRRAAKGAR